MKTAHYNYIVHHFNLGQYDKYNTIFLGRHEIEFWDNDVFIEEHVHIEDDELCYSVLLRSHDYNLSVFLVQTYKQANDIIQHIRDTEILFT